MTKHEQIVRVSGFLHRELCACRASDNFTNFCNEVRVYSKTVESDFRLLWESAKSLSRDGFLTVLAPMVARYSREDSGPIEPIERPDRTGWRVHSLANVIEDDNDEPIIPQF